MSVDVHQELARLETMTLRELQARYARLFGHPTRGGAWHCLAHAAVLVAIRYRTFSLSNCGNVSRAGDARGMLPGGA